MSDPSFAEWVWNFGPLAEQQLQVARKITQVIADIEQLRDQPDMDETKRATLARAIGRWRAIYQQVVKVYEWPEEVDGDADKAAAPDERGTGSSVHGKS